MSTSLMHSSDTPSDSAAIWSAVCAVAEDATVRISDETVCKAATLLKPTVLTNGETITAYPPLHDGDNAAVFGFGPGLLEEGVLAQLRELLAAENEEAVRLLDTVIELGVQIELMGTEYSPAHIKAVNWAADNVDFCLSNGRFHALLDTLGIERESGEAVGEVDFATFEQAVEARGYRTGMAEELNAFLACAKRHNAATVYWG